MLANLVALLPLPVPFTSASSFDMLPLSSLEKNKPMRFVEICGDLWRWLRFVEMAQGCGDGSGFSGFGSAKMQLPLCLSIRGCVCVCVSEKLWFVCV